MEVIVLPFHSLVQGIDRAPLVSEPESTVDLGVGGVP
jgi:hypothetical protein